MYNQMVSFFQMATMLVLVTATKYCPQGEKASLSEKKYILKMTTNMMKISPL